MMESKDYLALLEQMNKIIKKLREWNKAYPEYFGLIFLKLFDDESCSVRYDMRVIHGFMNIEQFLEVDPYKYRQENS
jgi:hypothetical protein